MEANLNPENEALRLDALHEFQLLDTEAEQDFDEIVALASELCEAPIAMVGFVGTDQIWIKSKHGTNIEMLDRDMAFCHHTIQQKELFIIPDARLDPRFCEAPLVAGPTNIQFYAGMPLLTDDGFAIGTLCVIDKKPRELTTQQRSILRVLGKQIETLLKLRLKIVKLDETNRIIKANKQRILESEYTLSTYFNSSNDAVFLLKPDHTIKSFNKLAESFIKNNIGRIIQVGESMLSYIPTQNSDDYLSHFKKALAGEESRVEVKVPTPDSYIWWAATYLPVRDAASDHIIGVILATKNIDKRKKAEEALVESKQLITGIADNLPNGTIFQYILELDGSHRFPYVSSGATKLFGHEAADIIKNPMLFFDLIQEEKHIIDGVIHYSRDFLTDFDFQYPLMVNGELKWLHTKSKPKRLANGATQWDGLTIDITEQKKAQELIEKTKQELQDVITTIPDILFRFDKNNRYTYCHASNPSDLLLPKEQLLGKRIEEVFSPEDAEFTIRHLNEARQTGQIVIFEYSLDIPLKGISWYEARIVKTNDEELLTIIRNITERKKAEAALQESEANLKTVFDSTEVGYFLFNKDLQLVSFNTPAQEFTMAEFHQPLAIGRYFFDYFPNETKERLKSVIKEVLEGKKVSYERLFPRKEGDEQWYLTKYSPVFSKENNVVGMVMSTERITERKKNELQLHQSFELVTEQNKRLLNFSYIVSHNLRSHTSNIKSILDIMDYVESEDERKEMMQILKNVSNALNETIHDLNDVVSIHTNLHHTVESLNLRDYVEKTILVLGEQIFSKNAKVNNNVAKEWFVEYTPAYLDSILLNFVSNAIKYSHPERAPEVSISCLQKDDKLVLVIKDNGIGIDLNKNGDKLFGMYKTFNGNTDARGIGLFITKNQIEAMGGKVEVESELGKGSTFSIYMR